MCLIVTRNKPWNEKKIRWKCVRMDWDGSLTSPLLFGGYDKTVWMTAVAIAPLKEPLGFHVFVYPWSALLYTAGVRSFYVAKVEVDGFRTAGFALFPDDEAETWNRMRILKVYPKCSSIGFLWILFKE